MSENGVMLLQKIYQKIANIAVNSSNVLLKPIIYINKDPTNSRQWFNDGSFGQRYYLQNIKSSKYKSGHYMLELLKSMIVN